MIEIKCIKESTVMTLALKSWNLVAVANKRWPLSEQFYYSDDEPSN